MVLHAVAAVVLPAAASIMGCGLAKRLDMQHHLQSAVIQCYLCFLQADSASTTASPACTLLQQQLSGCGLADNVLHM